MRIAGADQQLKSSTIESMGKYVRKYENEWRFKNSHCSLFGVYSFNFKNWINLNPKNLKTWCNSTKNAIKREYLAGYLKHSNLLILVVENQKDFLKCDSIESLVKKRKLNPSFSAFNESESFKKKSNYSINRYRSKTMNQKNKCYDYFANESEIFQCVNSFNFSFESSFVYVFLVKLKYFFLGFYSLFLAALY